MTKIVSLVKPTRAEVVYSQGNFANAKEALESEGYRVASAQDIAQARIEQGKDADVSRYGGWTKDGFLYLKNNDIRLTKNSPIMANAKEAVECHRNGREFYLTKEQLEQAVEGSVQINENSIPTNRFGENEITTYLFGEQAKAYGEFLNKKCKIENLSIYLANAEEKPFARQLWFGGIGNVSVLDGNGRYLGCGNNRAFGVRFCKELEEKQK